jgi:hypothetical protein
MTKKGKSKLSHGLQIVLEVMELVRRDGHDRIKAIQIIADRRRIARATVNDKCCRRLELKAEQFDKMLMSPKMHDLRKLLNKRFPNKADIINEFIDSLIVLPAKNIGKAEVEDKE